MAYINIGRQLLIAWVIPILGGVLQYVRFKEQDQRLANILLTGSFGIPVFLAGGVLGARIEQQIGVIITTAVFGTAGVILVLQEVFKENPYRELLWACYLYLPGAIYLYYGSLKDQPRLRRAVGTFLKESVVLIVIASLILGTAV